MEETYNQIRKAENRGKAGKQDRSERTRWMWLKNRVTGTEKEAQKGDSMALERYATGVAYELSLVQQGSDE